MATLEELREKQVRKRSFLTLAVERLANMDLEQANDLATFVTNAPDPKVIAVKFRVDIHDGDTLCEILDRINNTGGDHSEFVFDISDWGEAYTFKRHFNRLETPEEQSDRLIKELANYKVSIHHKYNKARIQQQKEIASLEKQLQQLANAERNLLGVSISTLRQQALDKLTEPERAALGLIGE